MAKSLNDVLKGYTDAISGKRPASTTSALTTGDNPGVDYADKMKDTRDFLAMHSVEKHADRNGNGDDVFKASKVDKAKMERHGHEPKPKDIKIYNKTQQVAEAKDNREYDYEGEMAVTKLKTICRHAEHLIEMMKPNTNLPEWVQSKIVKAEDYISTAHDYLMSEMNEEVNLEEATAISKIKQIAGPGKVVKKSPSDLSGKHHDGYLSQMINHDVYTHKGKDSVRVFKVHNKTKKVSEIKGQPPLMNEEVEALEEGGSQYRSAAGSGRNTNSNLSRLARKLSFEKPKSYRPHGTPSKAESKAFLDAEVDKFMKKGGKIRKEEVEELDEAKCNMTEAGKMCEVHGMKDCKKSSGKKLLLDKDIKEKTMTDAEKKKEESLKDKYDDSDMKAKMKKQYGDKKGEQVYFAYIRKKAMSESLSDQRSAKATASEKAREKMMDAIEKKKLQKEKMKEQAAPAETPITLPVNSSTHGFGRI